MSVLYTGASIVVFDESPLEPDPHILLRIAQNSGATAIGMGAKIYDGAHNLIIFFVSYSWFVLEFFFKFSHCLKSICAWTTWPRPPPPRPTAVTAATATAM
jgi:hypothetical protein